MNYPVGLSSEQSNRVERARDLAEIELRRQLNTQKDPQKLNIGRDFVFAVFKVMAKQIAEAERDGVLSGSEGRSTLDHFVQWELIPHAYELAQIRSYTLGFYSFSLEAFRGRLMEMLLNSDLWTSYLAERLAAWSEVPGRQVTAAVISRRKRLVTDYRRAQGWTAADLARHWGMSETAIRGVIREDRSRFNVESQASLLGKLGVSIESWYQLP